jgi:hypothetical protein
VAVVAAPAGAPGGHGGLFVKLAAGYRFAREHLPFQVLLRLDADALVIGPGIAELAAARFEADPGLGLLGSYRLGPDGGRRSFAPAAAALRAESGWRGLRQPRLRRALRELLATARGAGYEDGEHPLGGAYLHSAGAVAELSRQGLLELPLLARSSLGEDQLFGLLTVAAGYRIGDFGGPGDPLALTWKGLPAEPAELLARRKVVVHSVRSFGQLGEAEIRGSFAAARAAEGR